ncbi:MAG: SDR family oxidoreductase [Lentimicrobiaceae bacterium]|nr:SDR family oxidoreductase [Lentimicrobiaceae bacterium]MCB9023278.1 SDR family oxidoreductase [Lentimicrobiaceae bacterium]MCO5267125.1 SDR family oxidoreductase [Lentimicrobium sp.]
MKNLRDKVVIITGGSSGIGYALAHEFGKFGARIVISARNSEKLNQAAAQLNSLGINTFAVQADVSIESDCVKLIETTVSKYGKIDILVNNAGISMRAAFVNTDLEVLQKLMNTNFWGTVFCTKHAMPFLLKSQGSVIGVISIAGYVGLPGRTGYSASKFAIRGFLDTLRCENLKTGLHVMVAAPGFTSSNIRNAALTANGAPQGETPRDEAKMMSADVAARKIVKATLKRKDSIVLTFIEGKFTVWLNSIFPKLASRLAFYYMSKEPDSPFK